MYIVGLGAALSIPFGSYSFDEWRNVHTTGISASKLGPPIAEYTTNNITPVKDFYNEGRPTMRNEGRLVGKVADKE